MAERLKIIEFKSQKEINRDRKEKLDQKKEDLHRRVDAIKNSHTQRSGRVRA
jgi:hypothetical protein